MSIHPFEVAIQALTLQRLRPVLAEEVIQATLAKAAALRRQLNGRTIWSINSTAAGGGVAEMLPSLLGYAKNEGIQVRWLVVAGNEAFFRITKRLHNGLHGSPGDGGLLGQGELAVYRDVSQANYQALAHLFRPGDVALVHDPQPAGLVPHLRAAGLRVAWRCHIGRDEPNELVHRSWEFLRPYLEGSDAFCFTRASYAPRWVDAARLHVIPPSIDPLAAKNIDLDADVIHAIIAHVGLVAPARPGCQAPVTVHRRDGVTSLVRRHADILHAGPLPATDAPLVLQVSRWDRLKDMPGVLRAFSEGVDDALDAHLALVGPAVHGVSDDPEAAAIYELCETEWRRLPHFKRSRIQLICLPMADVEENALMVNAIQSHASVVVQKSLREGFGLVVTEAMWKGRPVVASAVGGIQDQIQDGVNGRLLRDPTDIRALGAILDELLRDAAQRRQLGAAARQTTVERFLPTRHLNQLAALFERLL
jgi:trehalose synthase